MSEDDEVNPTVIDTAISEDNSKKPKLGKRTLAQKRADNVAKRNAQHTPEHAAKPDPDRRLGEHESTHDKPRARTRSRQRASDVENPFHVPVEEIPEGLTYEWKRYSNVGQENPFYIAQMRRQGWEPVPPSRHPNWVPPGYDKPEIIKEGLILMDRPIELTREAQAEQRVLAKQQVREAEGRLGMAPKDTLTRNHPGVEPKIVKEWGRSVPVTED